MNTFAPASARFLPIAALVPFLPFQTFGHREFLGFLCSLSSLIVHTTLRLLIIRGRVPTILHSHESEMC